MAQTKTRVVGSGNTLLRVNQRPVAFMTQVQDTAPTPVSPAVPIQGLDDRHPREIITANAVGNGSLTLKLVDLWDADAWTRIVSEFRNAADILDLYERQRRMASTITCERLIRKPDGSIRGRVYHGCVVTEIGEDETVVIGTMEKSVTVTMMYTHWSPL